MKLFISVFAVLDGLGSLRSGIHICEVVHEYEFDLGILLLDVAEWLGITFEQNPSDFSIDIGDDLFVRHCLKRNS